MRSERRATKLTWLDNIGLKEIPCGGRRKIFKETLYYSPKSRKMPRCKPKRLLQGLHCLARRWSPFIIYLSECACFSGLWVRMFSNDWTGTYSFIVAFKFAGCALGTSSSLFFCPIIQVYLMFTTLILAFIPYLVLEWKYDNFLNRGKKKCVHL